MKKLVPWVKWWKFLFGIGKSEIQFFLALSAGRLSVELFWHNTFYCLLFGAEKKSPSVALVLLSLHQKTIYILKPNNLHIGASIKISFFWLSGCKVRFKAYVFKLVNLPKNLKLQILKLERKSFATLMLYALSWWLGCVFQV